MVVDRSFQLLSVSVLELQGLNCAGAQSFDQGRKSSPMRSTRGAFDVGSSEGSTAGTVHHSFAATSGLGMLGTRVGVLGMQNIVLTIVRKPPSGPGSSL